MSLSFRVGRLFGIPIRVHLLFLALVGFLVASAPPGTEVAAVAYLGILFGSVLLHELGHALVARRFGAVIHDVALWPLGGLARMSGMPQRPWPELAVALAGPTMNLGLLLTALLLGALPNARGALGREGALASLASVNAALALFNLIPAFPMDGGRALRAILSARVDYLRATETAVRIGRICVLAALVVAAFGPLPFWPIAILGLFLWIQGSIELAQVRAQFGADPISELFRRAFGGRVVDDALRQQEAPPPPRPKADEDLGSELENYRGTLDEFFREKRKPS